LTDLKGLRDELKLTQERAARLLGISKNTWIRWERGEFKYDEEEVVSMLRMLAKQCRPEACSEYRNPWKKWDWVLFDHHVRGCKDCQAVVKYLAANIKKR
jgi:DNA-binding XRE family transcriptional regulator